ncbi:MAG: D-glycerate dehydrogenase [Cyanobacteria bacterium TGS_CYA1]|nr:D-glycerate dehydrogenase [Cyanobacteria bacterium TGS_CYA1]
MSNKLIKPKVAVMGVLQDAVKKAIDDQFVYVEMERSEPFAESEMISNLQGFDAVLCEPLDSVSPKIMDSCPSLKMVSNRAVGFDNVSIAEASKRGILVCNTPGVLDDATADLAFALLLACSRRICEADRYVRQGKWQGFQSDLMLGPDLQGKTCGIIGMGRIGKTFAKRAVAFGMEIIYTRHSKPDMLDKELERDLGARRVEIVELLSSSDFISIHCPLNRATRKLIGKKELSCMKESAILINTSRGAVIDQMALLRHLQEGKIFAAGLDVFEDEPNVPEEFFTLDNVVLTPHIGSACFQTRQNISMTAAQAIIDAFTGKKPKHLLNDEAFEQFLDSVNTKA